MQKFSQTVVATALALLGQYADGLSSPKTSSAFQDELRRILSSSGNREVSVGAASTAGADTGPGNGDPSLTLRSILSPKDRSRSSDNPDEYFYDSPMIVHHNDEAFRVSLSELYSEVLPEGGGGTFLDLGSSWTSHLPPVDPQPANVWLHGMNSEELERNSAGNGLSIVRSFNNIDDGVNAALLGSQGTGDETFASFFPLLPEVPDNSVDVVGVCASFQYWRFPERVAGEILRVLKPGVGRCVVSFSNRMFASKAVRANNIDDGVNAALLGSQGTGDETFASFFPLLPEVPDNSVDVVGVCASFQYWRFPERVAGEILRVLKPGVGRCVVSFSNRMFASKAVRAWTARSDFGRLQYVSDVLERGAVLRDGVSTDGSVGGGPSSVLRVEKKVSRGAMASMLSMPLSSVLGRNLIGDPFLAVVACKINADDDDEKN